MDGPFVCTYDGRLVAGIGGIINRAVSYWPRVAQDVRFGMLEPGTMLSRVPWTAPVTPKDQWPPIPYSGELFQRNPLTRTWPRRIAIHPNGRWLAIADPQE